MLVSLPPQQVAALGAQFEGLTTEGYKVTITATWGEWTPVALPKRPADVE